MACSSATQQACKSLHMVTHRNLLVASDENYTHTHVLNTCNSFSTKQDPTVEAADKSYCHLTHHIGTKDNAVSWSTELLSVQFIMTNMNLCC